MKVQVKRVTTGKYFIPARLDKEFINASIECLPLRGETMTIMTDRMDDDVWHTTTVKSVRNINNMIVIKTKNSIYHIKLGWKGE